MNKTPSEIHAMPVIVIDPATGAPATPVILYDAAGNPVTVGGTDGNIPDFSSQAEAEAGTATDKMMSPLRTAEAIAALAGGGASAVPPLHVLYADANGDDTTGDGSPSNPYLTAQKCYDVGAALGGAPPYTIHLGIGTGWAITTAANVNITNVVIIGEGCRNTALFIYNQAKTADNANGDGAVTMTLEIHALRLKVWGDGAPVVESDGGNYMAGSGATITITGDGGIFGIDAEGGSVEDDNGGNGTAGNGGTVVIQGNFIISDFGLGTGVSISTQGGASSNSTGIGGMITFDGATFDAASGLTLSATGNSSNGTINFARCSASSGTVGIGTDKGGNALF